MKKYCPYCKKEVKYNIKEKIVKTFKGVEIDAMEKVAYCNECKNELYVNELEKENNDKIYELYREKTDIIRPNDIINLREKYNISQRELTAILGFGKMTINRYERGGIPTNAQSDYIKTMIENKESFLKKVKYAYENGKITYKTFNKINEIDSDKIIINNQLNNKMLLREYINFDLYNAPNIYNGYKKFNLELVENIISYIASKVENLSITSVNKYLWYIDMLSFNQRTVGITGLTYQKQKYGPAILDRKYEEISKLDDKYIRNEYENKNGEMCTKIESKNNFNLSNLKQNEIDIIDNIIELFKNKKISEISDLSHKEEGWKSTKLFDNISFEYAINLKIINTKT